MKAIPNRTFLLKQTKGEDGKFTDIIAVRGKEINITPDEFKQFNGSFDHEATKALKDSKPVKEQEDDKKK